MVMTGGWSKKMFSPQLFSPCSPSSLSSTSQVTKKKTPLSATLRGPVTQWHVHLGESSPSTADEKVCFFDDFFSGLFYHVVEYPLKIVFFMLMDIQHQKNGL